MTTLHLESGLLSIGAAINIELEFRPTIARFHGKYRQRCDRAFCFVL